MKQKTRFVRPYIDYELHKLIEETRVSLNNKAKEIGINKNFGTIETTRIMAKKFKELEVNKNIEMYEKRKRKRKEIGFKMFDF